MHFTVITFKCTFRFNIKLQSRSTSTPYRDRDCHPVGDKTKEGPHRLPICTAITRIRKSTGRLHLTNFNTKFKWPDIKNNSRTSMDTCTYWHTWKRSGKQESKLSYQDAKTLFRNKRLADFKHSNGG